MDAFTDPTIREIVIRASSQIGKSTIIENILGFIIDQDPGPCLFYFPERESAEEFAKTRFASMVRDNPHLRDKIKPARDRDSGNTIHRKKFPGGHISFLWLTNPNHVAQRTARYVIIDDADRAPRAVKNEGDPIRLAKNRVKTYGDRAKVIIISTPTEKGRSHIDDEMELSDKRVFEVPCPECDQFQQITWERLAWEKEEDAHGGHIHKPSTVGLTCANCGVIIPPSDLDKMVRRGKWRATAPHTGIAGFDINELYSPWGSWEQIVKDFLDAKGDLEKIKTWENTRLGRSSKPRGEAPPWEKIAARAGGYRENTLITDKCLLTAGVDCQGNRLEYEVVAWGPNNVSWSVTYGVIPYGPTSSEAWAELDKVLDRVWQTPNGQHRKIVRMAVDTGHEAQSVYRYARQRDRVMAVKGRGAMPVAVTVPRKVDVSVDGRIISQGVKLWHLGVDIIKQEIYNWLEVEPPGKPTDDAATGTMFFPDGYSSTHYQQLCAEEIRPTENRHGHIRYIWTKIGPNERLDCRVYARGAAIVSGFDRITPVGWEKMLAPSAQVSNNRPQQRRRRNGSSI